ncbi:acriflavin resistance protein [Variovorax sp. WS11]|uniref:efflux RND transporter permease subunit n=1 Tax=Variovorax sp. WS11 TaxID=1105204 RepID=UPI000D0D33F0|nr:efflux RND transporter permease subunit [Variovorax sp. WS11]NDZ11781.1 efflux RND transporter permease subunit [Variovorax sp. WS11]PSL82324.1 acriflavin resistance protein [Variovorax sp. WS11]
MFTWIIGSSLRFRFLVLAMAATLLVFGTQQLRRMPVDVFPEFAPPKVEIQTEGPGMTATEVEELITIPMEDQLRGVPGVEYVRSSSVTGLSQVVLLFKMGTDLMDARQRVQERLKLAIAELPKSSGMPVMLQPLSSTSRVMKIGLSSKVYDQMDLSMIAYWTVKFRLMSVPGVANIPMWGDRIKSLQVQVDPSLMRAHNVTLNEVMETTSDALDIGMLSYSSGAKARIDGMVDTPNQRFAIHNESPVFSTEHLAAVPLTLKGRRADPPRLGDVGKVVWDTWPMVGDAVINDERGLMMIVEKLPWANTLEVTRGIEDALAALKPGLPGIEIDSTIFRPATFIELSMSNLTQALIIGCILVVLVLGAFLYEWRVALISVVAIPLSLVAAGVVLYLMGATINTMVLAGFIVALGDVVDDAIIDVENIVRRLRQHRQAGSGKSTARIILEASIEVRSAIVHATVIVVLAVTPVFFMGGLSGVFFEPLVLAYLVAMLASMVVALTVTPALCLLLLDRTRVERRESPLVPWLKRHYAAALSRVIDTPRAAFAAAIILVVAAIGVWPFLGASLLPEFKERDFLMHWVPPEGTSHPETFRITQAASRELRAIEGVRNFGAHIGRAVGGDEPYGVNFTENWISVDPKVDYDKTRASVEAAVAGYPGLYRDVQTYLKERIKEVLTGAGESIVVRIFGPELSVLREKAHEVEDALKGIPGLIDLHLEQQVDVPQVQVKVNLDNAARYGIKPGDVRRVVNILMSGIEVTDIHKGGKVYDVFVWTDPSSRRNVDDIREFMIDTPYGGRVRVADIADINILPTPNKIKRENNSRRIDIHANVKGRDLGSVASDVEQRLEKLQFPIGYYPQLLGEYKERQAAQRNLLVASVVVVVAIFLVLHATFGNLRLATLVFLALPAALVGAVLATFAADRVISLGSLVGIITILGLSARNGIMLIEHCRHLEREEGMPFGTPLVLRGAGERLSPILMTTLCTALALLPLIVPGSIPGHEVEHPMAVAILGGIITSSLLSLFVIPILYLRYGASVREPFAAPPLRTASP